MPFFEVKTTQLKKKTLGQIQTSVLCGNKKKYTVGKHTHTMPECSFYLASTGTNCKRIVRQGQKYCSAHVKRVDQANKRKAEEPSEPEVRKKAAPDDDDGFKNLPVTQIVCNLTRSLNDAQKLPCTEIGKKMASNFVRVSATRIFSDPYRSIMELVSNAIDAETHNKNPIGRFGMGFFSVFSLLLKTNDFQKLTVTTTQQVGKVPQTLELTVVAVDGVLLAGLSVVKPEKTTGTVVQLSAVKSLNTKAQKAIHEMLNKYQFSEAARITVNEKPINTMPKETRAEVIIEFNSLSFSVRDHGAGMGKRDIPTLLTPSSSSKGLKVAHAEEQKESVRCRLAAADRFGLVLCVNGVQIKRVELRGKQPSEEQKEAALNVILLPPSTKLPVARNDVILSDPGSFKYMTEGFEELLKLHIERQNVSTFRALVTEYAKESKQSEAYKLLDHVNTSILASKELLIPEKDFDIVDVCTELELPFVRSDLYSVSNLEHHVLEGARKKNAIVEDPFFEYTKAIKLSSIQWPIVKIPALSSLVFYKQNTKIADIVAFCENPLNGCMTKNQFEAQKKAKLISDIKSHHFKSPLGDDDDIFEERTEALLENDLLDPLIKNVNILWRNRFANKVAKPLVGFVKQLITLFITVVIDPNICSELLSVIAGKLQSTKFSPGYGVAKFNTHPISCKLFRDLKPKGMVVRAKVHTEQLDTVVKEDEPIPDMVLKLLKHDVSIFPGEIKPGDTLPNLGDNSILHMVDMLQRHFASNKLSTLLTDVHNKAVHIVESCYILHLFCMFFSMYEFRSVPLCLQIINRIRIELRQHVSLDMMLRTYTFIQCKGMKTFETAIATMIKPIYDIFHIIATAVSGTKFADWVSDKTIFNRWKILPAPDAEYKFSINDVMMFAYTDSSLQTSENFMRQDILSKIAAFAGRPNRDCLIQAVTIAVNFGNIKRLIESILSELFQNSSDAIKGSDLPEAKRRIDIGVNDSQLNFKDGVGIKDSSIMSLIVPFFSEKSGQLNASGEMGTGLFNLFRKPLCHQVIIGTKFHEHYVKITATPFVENGLVTDVDLHLAIFNEAKIERGTEVCLIFDKATTDGIDIACQVHLECLAKYFAAPFPVYLNKVHINAERLEDIYVEDGILTARGVTSQNSLRPSILTINGVPFGSLAENWYALVGPSADLLSKNDILYDSCGEMQLGTQTNLVIDIDLSQINPVQNRTEIVFKSPDTVQFNIKRAQVVWMLGLYAKNKLLGEFIQHTDSSASLNQIQFYHGKLPNTWEDNWLPREFLEFVKILHWVIHATIQSRDKDEKGFATNKIKEMQVDQVVKDAMLRWFERKQGPAAHAEPKLGQPETKQDDESDIVQQIDEIMSKQLYTNNSIIQAFAEAFIETFNTAIDSKKMTLSTDSALPMNVARSGNVVPSILIVNPGVRFDVKGCWTRQYQVILLKTKYQTVAKNFIADVKEQDQKKLNDLFTKMVKDHFFTEEGTTIVHEILHCILNSTHSKFAHANLKMVWKGQTFTNTFDGMTAEVYDRLCEMHIGTNFLARLQKLGSFRD